MNYKNRFRQLIFLCFLVFQGCFNKQQENDLLEDHKYSVMILYSIETSIIEKKIKLGSEKEEKELESILSAINKFNGKLIDQAGGISSDGYFPAIGDPHNSGSDALIIMEMYKFQFLLESYLSNQLYNGRIDNEQHKTLLSILHNYLDKDNGILAPSIIERAKISDVVVHILLLEMWLIRL